MKNEDNGPKPGQPELPEPLSTIPTEPRIIPESQKDIDPIFRKPHPRSPGTRTTFL